MRAGRPSWLLATLAGWPQAQTFSNQLHARRVKATPINVERFRKIAAIVGYSGELFLDEEEQP
jgi:hypothetical protein